MAAYSGPFRSSMGTAARGSENSSVADCMAHPEDTLKVARQQSPLLSDFSEHNQFARANKSSYERPPDHVKDLFHNPSVPRPKKPVPRPLDATVDMQGCMMDPYIASRAGSVAGSVAGSRATNRTGASKASSKASITHRLEKLMAELDDQKQYRMAVEQEIMELAGNPSRPATGASRMPQEF